MVIGEEDEDEDGDEDDDEEEDEDQMESSEESEDETEIDYEGIDETKLNLDITAMIAYVSSLTNGRNMFQFREKILSEQAAWERSNPVKPELDKIFLNKELICCQSAMTDFQTILNTLGGESERERGLKLIERIKVVPDRQSSKTEGLHMSGESVKDQSLALQRLSLHREDQGPVSLHIRHWRQSSYPHRHRQHRLHQSRGRAGGQLCRGDSPVQGSHRG